MASKWEREKFDRQCYDEAYDRNHTCEFISKQSNHPKRTKKTEEWWDLVNQYWRDLHEGKTELEWEEYREQHK